MNDLDIVIEFLKETIEKKNISLETIKDPKVSNEIVSDVFNFIFKDENNIFFKLNHSHELENLTLSEAKERQDLFNYDDLYESIKMNVLININLLLKNDQKAPFWSYFEEGLFAVPGRLNCQKCGISSLIYFDYTEQKFTTIRHEVKMDNEKISCLNIPDVFHFSLDVPSGKLVILTDFQDLINNIENREDFFENSISYQHGKIQECKHYLKHKIGYIYSIGSLDYIIKENEDRYLVSAKKQGNVIAKLNKEENGICFMDQKTFAKLCKKQGLRQRDFSITYLSIPKNKVNIEYDLNNLDFNILH